MIRLHNLILGCCLVLYQISPSVCNNFGRIVGGVPAVIEDVPYLVQLRSNDFIFCSGTLVSEYYVISAAHCFEKIPQNFTVVGGATNSYNDPGSVRSNVRAYAIPKNFNNDTYNMDIAVIKLKTPLVGATVQPIAMDCDGWKDNAVVKLFGWGKKDEDDKTIPVQLQTVEVRTIEQGWCKWLYFAKKRPITPYMFCAMAKGKDACSGDSGGPAIVNNQFCGIVSWAVGCAQAQYPGVYTDLRKFSTFVNRSMEILKAYY